MPLKKKGESHSDQLQRKKKGKSNRLAQASLKRREKMAIVLAAGGKKKEKGHFY